MNSINFYSGDKFPQYRQSLVKMQDMINLVASLAGIGGQNFILSGCNFGADEKTSDGLIVINGEILPFVGGETKSKITIKETRQDETAFNVVYPELYITRVAQFSEIGEYNWSDFEQLKSNIELYKYIRDIMGDAPGIIKEWAGMPSKIPTDYMLCDGRDLAISDYPELYEAIGVTFGGDGLTSFKLPNTRGRFSVSYSGAGDYSRIGMTGGEEKHTLIESEIPEHDHTNSSVFNKFSAKAGEVDEQSTPGSVDKENAAREYNVGGMSDQRWVEAKVKKIGGGKSHENRPPYIVFAKIIKVR